MPKKKLEVVELNKKEEKIILEESDSALALFWRRHRTLIFSLLLILSLSVFGVSAVLFAKNMYLSEEPNIKQVSIDVSLTDYEATISGSRAMDSESAKERFLRNNMFKRDGEVLLVKKIEHEAFTIKYFSDGTALKLMKKGTAVTRIAPLDNGKYGIDEDGVISSKARVSEVTITSVKEYPWGKVTYFSDNSADVSGSKYDMFVRNSRDVKNDYISDNKLAYLKETKTVGNNKLNYYYDGTIEVIKNGKSYLVRTSDDLSISGNNVTFKNNNQAEIYDSKKMADGVIIDYYTDGGAIIKNGTKNVSLRKSNSIVIKDNKIYEIMDSIYVEVSKKTNDTTYYTNGSAVVKKDGKTYYVPENSNIKYHNDKVDTIGNPKENLSKENHDAKQDVLLFEETAVITTPEYTAIIPKEKVMYDEDGKVKEPEEIKPDEEEEEKAFTIKNNTNDDLKYRVVLEQSPKTTLDTSYIRYQLLVSSNYVGPKELDKDLWTEDKISKELKISGTNYILINDTIAAHDEKSISLMLWTDYDTIPNSMQNKYFYGTIRVYAWSEKK